MGDAEAIQFVEQTLSHFARQRMIRRHERVGRRQIGGRTDQRLQRAEQFIVQFCDREQADHRNGGRSRRRMDVRGAAVRQGQRPVRTEPGQIGLVQDDDCRPLRLLTIIRSSGLSVSAITTTATSAAAASVVTATPASVNAADTVAVPTPLRPAPQRVVVHRHAG